MTHGSVCNSCQKLLVVNRGHSLGAGHRLCRIAELHSAGALNCHRIRNFHAARIANPRYEPAFVFITGI
jgi:hypothetical protein